MEKVQTFLIHCVGACFLVSIGFGFIGYDNPLVTLVVGVAIVGFFWWLCRDKTPVNTENSEE